MASDKFKVFISWSGQLSKDVAAVWRDLIQETFDTVEPFMSEENVGAGERGLAKIAAELSGTKFGVIVVTQENQNSPWLNYEAGALSKDVEDESVRVAPTLVDFERKNDVSGPLGQFQASLLTQEGVEYILVEIAKVVGADEASIRKRFANSWREEYKARFSAAKDAGGGQAVAVRRSNDEILDEILTVVREIGRELTGTQMGSEPEAVFRSSVGRPSVRREPIVLEPGDYVDHPKYGQGRVEEVTGIGHNAIAVIDFRSAGRVKLMYNEAPIEKLPF